MKDTLHSSRPLVLLQLDLLLVLLRPICQTNRTTLPCLADGYLSFWTRRAGHRIAVHDTALLTGAGLTQRRVIPGGSVIDKLALVHTLAVHCVYTLAVL